MTNSMNAIQRVLLSSAFAHGMMLLALMFTFPSNAFAIQLMQTLDSGDQNSSVTSLQTFLAADPALYPSGLVTGYYGALTRAAVEKFQIKQGIVTSGTPATTGFGRVGPKTFAVLNSLMGGGSGNAGSNVSWDTVPVMSTPVLQLTSTTVTFSWTTNEATIGEVYWDTVQIRSDEATGSRQKPFISGTLATDAGNFQTDHSVTISNLQSNTTYHYLIRVIDSYGNVTMMLPLTFRTSL